MNKKKIDWAIFCTFLWIIFWLALLMKGFDSVEGFGGLGAFLSGVFAPLALFWFYKSYRIQSTELKLQREEITLQRKAFQESAIAQQGSKEALQKQSKALEAQLEITQKQFAIFEEDFIGKKPIFILVGNPNIELKMNSPEGDIFEVKEVDFILDKTTKELYENFTSTHTNISVTFKIKNIGLACFITHFNFDIKSCLPKLETCIFQDFSMYERNPIGQVDDYGINVTFSNPRFNNLSVEETFKSTHKILKNIDLVLNYRDNNTSSSQKYLLKEQDRKLSIVKMKND